MCTYITYISPAGFSDKTVAEALKPLVKNGVQKHDNPQVTAALKAGESAWIGHGGCDCGTWLGQDTLEDVGTPESDEAKAAKLRRKGWSEAKIQRALADARHVEHQHPCSDEQQYGGFIDAVTSFLAELQVPYLKLFWHYYSGHIDEEAIALQPYKPRHGETLVHALLNLPADTVITITAASLASEKNCQLATEANPS